MGRLTGQRRPAALPEAGELCAVEAIDREGLLVTSEGALVRYLRVTPKNPLVMSDAEREQVGHAFGQLVGRLAAGQSLQFYVEATPVRLAALLEAQPGRSRACRARAAQRHRGAGGRAAAAARARCASRSSVTPTPRRPSTSPTTSSFPTCPTSASALDWRQLLPRAPAPAGGRVAGAVA